MAPDTASPMNEDQLAGWHRALPNGKHISALGFGCASIWSKPEFADSEALAILEALMDEGINHFDTSPSYGVGCGERRLGAFLAGRDVSSLVISTKVGTNLINGNIVRGFTADLMERSFADSLERLGLDKVDILYLHGPRKEDIRPESPVFDFFDRQKRLGRITYSGVNSFDPALLDLVAELPIDAVMLQYNVGDFRNAAQVVRLHAAGKVVMSGTVLARAKFDFSTFIPKDRRAFWYLLRMMRNEPLFVWNGLKLARRLAATGKDPVEAAIQFAVSHPQILSHLFGTSKIGHARANARAGHGRLTPDMRRCLDLANAR